jgi:hypothetical protein
MTIVAMLLDVFLFASEVALQITHGNQVKLFGITHWDFVWLFHLFHIFSKSLSWTEV